MNNTNKIKANGNWRQYLIEMDKCINLIFQLNFVKSVLVVNELIKKYISYHHILTILYRD